MVFVSRILPGPRRHTSGIPRRDRLKYAHVILFDVDGTLITTGDFWEDVPRAVVARHPELGIEWPQAERHLSLTSGRSIDDRAWMFNTATPEEATAMGLDRPWDLSLEAFQKLMAEIRETAPGELALRFSDTAGSDCITVVPGARALTDELRRHRHRYAYVSGMPAETLAVAEHLMQLQANIHVSSDWLATNEGKPHPAGFIRAAELLTGRDVPATEAWKPSDEEWRRRARMLPTKTTDGRTIIYSGIDDAGSGIRAVRQMAEWAVDATVLAVHAVPRDMPTRARKEAARAVGAHESIPLTELDLSEIERLADVAMERREVRGIA
jgi:beta-phosphoglucomutase-like phosphatase (HAD superfamily)